MTPAEADRARIADRVEAAAYRDLFEGAPREAAAGFGLQALEVGGATALIAPRIPLTIFNRAIGLGLSRPATEADLDALIAAYRAAGCKTFWIHVSPCAQPVALADWLAARGFVIPERRSWAKMLRGTEPPPEFATPLEVREARPGEADAAAQAICAAFGMPPAFGPWLAGLAARPRWRLYAALAGATVAGAGYLYTEGREAWLGVGGVLPEFRGRSAHRALMAARIRGAIEAGCTAIVTETGEPVGGEPNASLANMRRCGFAQVASRLNYEAAG